MIIVVLALSVFASFSFVLLFGAPYLPTLKKQIQTSLDLLDLKPGETMLELGCGDGRVLIAAAERGIHAVGYELNPYLAAVCWLRTRRYRGQTRIVWGDYWRAEWPAAHGIYGFILAKYMKKLDTKIMQQRTQPRRLVSFAFEIPGKKPSRTKDGLFLYEYK